MGKVSPDLSGQKFGRLLVVRPVERRVDRRARYRCLCNCGKLADANGKDLVSGNTRSCGCLRLDKVRDANLHREYAAGESHSGWKGGKHNLGSLPWAKKLLSYSKHGAATGGYAKCSASPEAVCLKWVSQNGKCAISGRCFDGDNAPCLDHDHTTGELRGFICRGMNTGLGGFEDSPELLIQAAEYLQNSRRIDHWLRTAV